MSEPVTFSNLQQRSQGIINRPLCIAYGMGVDSTAMIVALARLYQGGVKEARPDLILFADTGGEKPETYEYENVIQCYLKSVGFPELITVRYTPKTANYSTLEENCLQNKTLPSLAFGYKKCSLKFKRQPQDKFTNGWTPAKNSWQIGQSVIKAIGYDAGDKDARRSSISDDKKYHYWYPLRELGWKREDCIEEIEREGLQVPSKSACFFCPASKPHEIADIAINRPDLAARIVRMEQNAAPYLTTIEGLWRSSTKTRPGCMSEFIMKIQIEAKQ